MGCSESKNKKEESLSCFEHRIHFIKEAISGRNALFAALSAYAICLKNTGAAFTDGCHPHFSPKPSSPSPPPPPTPTPPPPPPPPPPPIKTPAYPFWPPVRMPEFIPKPVVATIIEEESDSEAEELTRKEKAVQGTSMHQGSAWDYFFPEEDTVEKKVKFSLPVRLPEVKPKPVVSTIMEVDSNFKVEELTRSSSSCSSRGTVMLPEQQIETTPPQDWFWKLNFPEEAVVEEKIQIVEENVKLPLPVQLPEIKPKSVVSTTMEVGLNFEVEELTRNISSSRGAVLLPEKQTETTLPQEWIWKYFFPEEDMVEEKIQIVEDDVELPLPMQLPDIKPEPAVSTIMEENSNFEVEELTRNSSSTSSGGGDVPVPQQQMKGKAIQETTLPQESFWKYSFPVEDVVEEEIVERKVKLPLQRRPPVVKKRVTEIARKSREPVSLMQIFGDLDNHFLKAFESTLEVSQMLDYHSNVAVNQQNEHIKTLADVLNKLLAWETKLYDELKVGEAIKCDYQKVSLFNKQKIQGTNPKSLEKLKASITNLHTRYLVEIQSAVSVAAKIISIRDEQLYPKLVQLVYGMAMMWKCLLLQHESQFKIVYPLKSLDNIQALNGSSKYQYNCTIQLCGAVRVWHTQFSGLIEYQKNFVRALHRWSNLSLIPIETNLEEKMNPLIAKNAPIHELLIAWKNDLDELPDEAARNEIRNFATVIQTIVDQQHKELKLKETCRAIPEEKEPAIVSLKQRLEEDEEACQTICKPANNKSLESLKHSLPDFFRALSEIAQACSTMYHNLRKIAENHYEQKGGKGEKKVGAPTGGGETKDDGKTVSVYKMNMHCEGCAKKIIKVVNHFEGVEVVEADLKENKLTVTGKVDPWKVKARLEEKEKRTVDIVSPQITKIDSSGDKTPEEKK